MAISASKSTENRFRKNSPGPQYAVRDKALSALVYGVLLLIVVLLCLYAIVMPQISPELKGQYWLWHLELFDPGAGLSILVALGALMYTRRQIIDSFFPYLSYQGRTVEKGETLAQDAHGVIFTITLENSGNGMAILQDTKYHLATSSEEWQNLTHEKVCDQLQGLGLQLDTDIHVRGIGAGYGLSKDSELVIFEARVSRWDVIRHLDCTITFRGIGGSVYGKEIFLIPRDRESRFGQSAQSIPDQIR